jgi:Immunoglobulin I-set domain/Immunoglobulin domain
MPGESLTLSCKSDSGWPRAKPTWYFNGRELPNNSTSPSQLKLHSLRAGEDFGPYQCELSNPAGVDMASVWVRPGDSATSTSKWQSQLSGTLQRITDPPVDTVVRAGDEITLPCGVSAPSIGSPVKWRLNGHDLSRASDVRVRVDANSTLTIAPAKKGDSGRYSCLVGGESSTEAIQASAQVTVLGEWLLRLP